MVKIKYFFLSVLERKGNLNYELWKLFWGVLCLCVFLISNLSHKSVISPSASFSSSNQSYFLLQWGKKKSNMWNSAICGNCYSKLSHLSEWLASNGKYPNIFLSKINDKILNIWICQWDMTLKRKQTNICLNTIIPNFTVKEISA